MPLLQLADITYHGAEVFQAFCQCSPLRRDVHVVEAVVIQPELVHQLKSKSALARYRSMGSDLPKFLSIVSPPNMSVPEAFIVCQ